MSHLSFNGWPALFSAALTVVCTLPQTVGIPFISSPKDSVRAACASPERFAKAAKAPKAQGQKEEKWEDYQGQAEATCEHRHP